MPGTAFNSAAPAPAQTDLSIQLLPDNGNPEAPRCETETPLDRALDLIVSGRPREADHLLTAALLESPDRADLWLAAGIARVRRGAFRSAVTALRMATWIGDDPLARELLYEIEG